MKLYNPLFQVANKLKTISHEAKQATANMTTLRKLEEQLKLAKTVGISPHDLEEPKKLLKLLRKIDDSVSFLHNFVHF